MSRYNNNRSDSELRPKRKPNQTYPCLISCCLFLTIICVCLLTALVLIGKHLIYNNSSNRLWKSNIKYATKQSIYRLPNYTIPVLYDLTLKPDLDLGKFNGLVNITLNITKPSKEIIIHGKNLSIDNIQLIRLNDSKVFHIENVQEIVNSEILIIITKENITSGSYYLIINYSGNMTNRIVGLYRSQYTNPDTGQKRFMATSKFEPTYARQAFPCFDEPNFKASYKVHILKPNDSSYIALSNYPQTSEEVVDGGIMVHFNETVPMSTYLSCFIVSDFTNTETFFENGGVNIPFRVYASPAQLNKTEYAGKVGASVIEYYIKYFNIPYPLPKLDMVAIPDFVSGAMEHWGLVTYRETALLYTQTTHSSSNKQRVATVVAHELAHSWFGNLVTMNWWNDLWLNEGFASYIEYKGVQHAEPTWGMLDQFLTAELHPVLSLDATQSSHPIITTVVTPDQITEVFDTISYNKGASVLRMLEDTVGEKNFQDGITNYLNKHNFSNAITQDLWNEIQAVVGTSLNVTEFMNTFTIQMGYPVINVAFDGTKYTLTQKRFLKDYESADNSRTSPLNYKWSIPVKYVTDLGKSDLIWFDYKSNDVVIEKPAGAKWLKFNPEQIGYYRINYPLDEWMSLINIIKDLSVSDRTHLLEESFSIAESGELDYTVPLNLTKYLINELDYVPWSVASSMLENIATYIHNTEHEANFKKYVISILKPAYENFTWNDEDLEEEHLTKLARVVVLSLACSVDYEDALNQATSKFNDWISTRTPLSQNLRGIIYRYGMVTASEDTWNKLFDIFTKESDASEKLKLMYGLTSVKNPSLLSRLIELAKDETYVRGQDYFTLLQYISANPIGTSIVWDYVREHWPELVERFSLNDRYLGRLIPAVTSTFSTNTKLEEMQHFFSKYPEAGAGASARQQALETVKNNIKWLSKYKKTIGDWISSNKIE